MRAFGLAQAPAGDSDCDCDWSIDWFRHCRELIVPADYHADEARAYVKNPRSYAVEIDAPALFALGGAVRGKMSGHSGHTRLPGYVRGRRGSIFAHHGGHVFPDASARGEQRAEHLYTISFAASELWPEAKDRRDCVFVDLWESYLELA